MHALQTTIYNRQTDRQTTRLVKKHSLTTDHSITAPLLLRYVQGRWENCRWEARQTSLGAGPATATAVGIPAPSFDRDRASARIVRHLRRCRPSRRHAARSSRPERRFRLRRSRHPRSSAASVVRHLRHGTRVAAVVPARSHPAGLLHRAAVGSRRAALRRSTGLCPRPVAVSVVHRWVVRHHL